ncbi:MAG: heme-binding protein [Halobacteriota archaeon]
MAEPPQTDEGWYVLHDFRTVDWDAWRALPERDRERAIQDGIEYLSAREAVTDSEEGASAAFAIVGEKADLLFLHLRPTLDDLSRAERKFEQCALAGVVDRSMSYVSVTEVSGYVSTDYFDGNEDAVDEGLRRYIESKMKPDIPEDEYLSFYPMSKRRGETYNWYDLSFEERSELMSVHGETGKQYAGKIKQMIASSVGFDDYEWGVTLFAADPTDIKDIVYEMRFDDVSSKYGEFGSFYVGRRFPPHDLGAFFDGETVPTGDEPGGHPHGHSGTGDHPHGHGHGENGDSPHGHDHDHDHGHGDDHGQSNAGSDAADASDIRGELAELNIYAGQPHGEDVYATVLYSEADSDELSEEVSGLRESFDHYPTHEKTAVYEATDRDRTAVVSIWETASAAETAAGFLSELPGIVERAGEESGFGTMGMFYTTKPEHREEFVEKFDAVGGVLAEMDGHVETDLMVNRERDNDMFIASQWRSKADAMAFFRSDDFRETVTWGRDVLADRPRHVFLA